MLAVTILGIGVVGVLRSYTISVTVLGLIDSTITGVSWLKDKMAEIENELIVNGTLWEISEKGIFEKDKSVFKWEVKISEADIDEENLAEDVTQRLDEVWLSVQDKNPRVSREYILATYTRKPVPVEKE